MVKQPTVYEIRQIVYRKYPQYLPHLLTRIEQQRLSFGYNIFQSKAIKHDLAIHLLQQAMLAEALKASMGDEQYLKYARTAA